MKKEIFQTVEIPEGVSVQLEDSKLTVKGPEGELSRDFRLGKVQIKINEKEISIGNKSATKNEKKVINTLRAHIQNMIKGVKEKFVYKLKICYGHFPFTVKQEGNKIKIKNFLGEKFERVVNIPEGIEIEINKEIITVKSTNKELAGQASANFEVATKIRGRDKRKFQDGIYIVEKDGRKI